MGTYPTSMYNETWRKVRLAPFFIWKKNSLGATQLICRKRKGMFLVWSFSFSFPPRARLCVMRTQRQDSGVMDSSVQYLLCIITRQILLKCHKQNKCQVYITLMSRLVLNPWRHISKAAVMNIPVAERKVTFHKGAVCSEPQDIKT